MRQLITILILFFCLSVQALASNARFERLTIDDGLSMSALQVILQDQSGYLWFATQDGLNRYDGYEFKIFRHDPKDPKSISDNWVNSLYEDNNGVLWIGTKFGLDRFDAATEQFTHFKHDSANPGSLGFDVVRAVIGDGKDGLWVGTEKGLDHFDGKSGKFTHYVHDENNPASLSHDLIRALFADSKGQIWVGTDGGGLNRFDSKTGGFIDYRHDPINADSLSADAVWAIAEDHIGQLWVGTNGGGLNRFDQKTGEFVRFSHVETQPLSLSNNNVNYIYEDARHNLWIGTDNGLNRYNVLTGHFTRYKSETSDRFSLSNNRVWTLFADETGVLWIGTHGGGISKYDTKRERFQHFSHSAANPDSLSNNIVKALTVDEKDQLWVGTAAGLNRYESDSARFVRYRHSADDDNSLSHDEVSTVFEDSRGALWIGTLDGGLNRFNEVRGGFEHFTHSTYDAASLSNNRVNAITQDIKGQVWFGTDDGLNRFDHKNENFTSFKHNAQDPHSLGSSVITALLQDNVGVLWVGTVGGLNSYDARTGKFTRYNHQDNNNDSLSHDVVTMITTDSKGTLWVGTLGGLNRLDVTTGKFTQYRQSDGLPNDVVYGMLEDRKGRFWISTNQGLSRFDPVDNSFKNYTLNDGLQSNEFNFGSYYQGKNNEMFFGGINGFNRFFADDIKDYTRRPKVVLTEFLLLNQSVPINAGTATSANNEKGLFSIEKAINTLPALRLSHKESLISFGFSAMDFTDSKDTEYAYKLEGWDKDWIYTDAKNRRATYTNMPDGDYVLRVKAANKDGYWNEEGKSLNITIDPAPWNTWWAYTFYALCLIGMLLAFVNVQRQKLRDEEEKVQQEQALNQQLKQVDKLKDEFLANTSHELRTPLNGIIGLAESLIDGVRGELPIDANKDLVMVVSSGRRLANLVNDILDFSKLKSHDLVLYTKPLDLHAMVEVVVTLSTPLVADKPLHLVNDVPRDLPAVLADEDRIQQILHNLIGNGIKFTEQGSVTVTAAVRDEWIEISVIDTGIGIPKDKFDVIFESFEQVQGSAERNYGGTGLGLAVTKNLVDIHGGKVGVDSVEGRGSTFSFTMPTSEEAAMSPNLVNQAVSRLHYVDSDQVHKAQKSAQNVAQLATEAEGQKHESIAQSDYDSSKFKILLVDDEPVNRQVLNNHLCREDYQLVEASGGQQAIDAVINDGPFDLILLDIMMPKVSGYDVCTRLREIFSIHELPVIFLTAKSQVADLVQSFAVGANDYLSKPIVKHELLTRVETHLKLLDVNRNLEQKVAVRTEALEKATQAKSDFLAKMSHEIRTPMNAVIGLSRLALKTALDDRQHDYVSKVVDAGEALLGLINDILDFSKIEAGKLTIESIRFNVNRLLDRSITLSAMNAHLKGLELVTDIDSNIPQTLIGDPLRLQQIIVNLVNNAVKFTEKGVVCIRIGIKKSLDHQLLLQCSVIDTGIGMTPKQQGNMFQSFSQADESVTRKFGGTGLGLAISKQLCELMGGEIWLESEEGRGSIFHFTVMVDKVLDDTQLMEVDKNVIKDLKILVVDDMELSRVVLCHILSDLGITAAETDNGHTAIDMIEEAAKQSNPYDLVLMDWRMPGMDGIETTQKLHQRNPDDAPHILMVSAYDKDEARAQIGKTPIKQFLEKPISSQGMRDALIELVTGQAHHSLPIEDEQTMDVPDFSNSHILLVEDNAINRQVALGFLEDSHIQVDIADNGLIALEKIKQTKYDLVLMDIQMPEMDGITATGHIRNELNMPDLVVIAMTAHAMAADVKRSMDAGMNDHINKPIDPDVMYRKMLNFLEVNDGDLIIRPSMGDEYITTRADADTKNASANVDGAEICEVSVIEQLSRISGLDSKQALGRMNNKTELYLGLVRDFDKDQRGLDESLMSMFDDNSWEELYRTVHSLKSNAAYIGAFSLSQLSDELESALGNKDYDKDLLVKLCCELAPLLAQLKNVFALDGQTLVEEQDAFNANEFIDSLKQILPLLRSSDFAAEDQLPTLVKLCAQSDYIERVNQIAEEVDNIEYESAFDIAVELLAEVELLESESQSD